MIKTISIFLICLMLTGCATMQPLKRTPSGRPEVIIYNTTRKEVIDTISNYMLEEFRVEHITDYSITFSKHDTSFMTKLWIGQVKARVTFNLLDIGSGIRVMATIEAIAVDGEIYDYSRQGVAACNIQTFLEKVKSLLER